MSNVTERISQMETPIQGGSIKTATDKLPGAPEYTLEVEPRDFESTSDSKLITTIQLGSEINAMFRPFFKDYVGSNIILTTVDMPAPNAVGANGFVNPNQPHAVGSVKVSRLEVELYFQSGFNANRCAEGAIKNIVERGKEYGKTTANSKSVELANKIAAINSKVQHGKNFTLSKETKDMLDEFIMPMYRKNENIQVQEKDPETGATKTRSYTVSKPRWEDGLIYEVTDSTINNPNMYGAHVKVTNLDLYAILRKMYGTKNEEGHNVDYEVKIVRPMTQQNSMIPVNTLNALLKCDRLDCFEVDRLAKSLGMMTVIGSLPINRG